MNLTENTYVHVIFFLECKDFNWMATIFREGDGPWSGEYRFRYFGDDKAHDSADRKSWFKGQAPDASDESLRAIAASLRHVGGKLAEHLEVPFEELTVEGGAEKTIEVLSQQPWANIKQIENPEKESV